MKNYKVYLIKKANNDIVYVGLTRQALSLRFTQHIARKTLNREDHRIELVQQNLTLDQSVILEEMLIKQYKTRTNGYSNARSEEHAAKNRIARLGKKNSPEHKQALLKPLKKPVMCIETGKVYDSARHAAKKLKLQYSKISLVCHGKRNTTGGLHFKFV